MCVFSALQFYYMCRVLYTSQDTEEFQGTWLVQSEEHETLDLGVVSLNFMLGIETA